MTGDSSRKIERLCSQKEIQLISKPFEIDDLLETVSFVQKKLLEDQKRALAQRQNPTHRDARYNPHAGDVTPKVDLSPYVPFMREHYTLPLIPNRAQNQLTQGIKRALDRMKHSEGQEYLRQRAFAYAGLITALVFDVRMSKLKDGKTVWQAYDDLLEKRGEFPEFKDLD